MRLSSPSKIFLLDIARGVASLAVVFWHFQHFFMVSPGALPVSFQHSWQPLYGIFIIFYEYGYLAVQFFFVLSGFVFFHVYLDEIRARRVSAWEFFVFRFSRLYPLHFVTLIVVAVGQWIAYQQFGSYVVYPANDGKHFLLNLLFISHWGLQDGWAFNAPVWSVSVEVLLYLSFFFFAMLKHALVWMTVLGLGGWLLAHYLLALDVGVALSCFYLGGGVFLLFQRICAKSSPSQVIAISSSVIVLLGSIAIAILSSMGVATAILTWLVFPSLVFLLALVQHRSRNLGQRFQWFGEITYSTYLLHFPLQLFLILGAKSFGIFPDYRSAWNLILFFGVLIAISIASYRWFEKPMQNLLRRTMIRRA